MKTHIVQANKLYRKEYDDRKIAIKKAAELTRSSIVDLSIESLSEFYKNEFHRDIIVNNTKAIEAFSLLSDTPMEDLCDEITEESMIVFSEDENSTILSIVHMIAHSVLHTNIILPNNNFKQTFKDSYQEWFNYAQVDHDVDIFMKYFLSKEEFEELLAF